MVKNNQWQKKAQQVPITILLGTSLGKIEHDEEDEDKQTGVLNI